MGQLITITKLVMVSITYVVINTVEKNVEYKRFNSLKYYDRKKEEIIFLDVDLAGVDHKQKIKKLKKTETSNMNMKATKQNIFTMGILITIRILIRNDYMG